MYVYVYTPEKGGRRHRNLERRIEGRESGRGVWIGLGCKRGLRRKTKKLGGYLRQDEAERREKTEMQRVWSTYLENGQRVVRVEDQLELVRPSFLLILFSFLRSSLSPNSTPGLRLLVRSTRPFDLSRPTHSLPPSLPRFRREQVNNDPYHPHFISFHFVERCAYVSFASLYISPRFDIGLRRRPRFLSTSDSSNSNRIPPLFTSLPLLPQTSQRRTSPQTPTDCAPTNTPVTTPVVVLVVVPRFSPIPTTPTVAVAAHHDDQTDP